MNFKNSLINTLSLLPAEPAFPCGDDNNSQSTTTGRDLDWWFFRAGGVAGGRIWICGFSGPAGVRGAGFGLEIFRASGGAMGRIWIVNSHCGAHFSLVFTLWRTFFIPSPAVAHIFY